ncbi:G-protein-signaling modulator 3 [Ochotona princeps]|uniref:G-protein-signaling modulator 3 n=1 Tax=Ochotona princeps TaxID=9978 RepID=UPI002715145B|nr:G-protein-signaling modulator 3 [Ochotona princeps]
MGGAHGGGLTRNPASCSVPRHPAPSSPPPLTAPTPFRHPRFLPFSQIPATPPPSVSPLQGMEAERPQEEPDGEQDSPQDEQGWPPLNSTPRPWRSAPPSPPPPGTRLTALGPRSASLLSLQTELLLDLVAEAQSRRLEEQRATFQARQKPPSAALSPAARPLEDREQLYSTILSHQCQRMEAQRSEPPLPPGGHELLELLLRVQGGGRMEEQRSRPPTHTC